MDLENIIPSEVRQRKTNIIMISHMWNLKNNTNESIYETDADSDIDSKFMATKGKKKGAGIFRGIGLTDPTVYKIGFTVIYRVQYSISYNNL